MRSFPATRKLIEGKGYRIIATTTHEGGKVSYDALPVGPVRIGDLVVGPVAADAGWAMNVLLWKINRKEQAKLQRRVVRASAAFIS